MLAESNRSPYAGGDAPKLRTACENCRQSKVKCNLSGKNVCTRCLRHGLQCLYGFANRSGKPKGSKNRATLRKLGQLQDEKPAVRRLRGSRSTGPVADMEPVAPAAPAGHVNGLLEDDVCLIPGSASLWESPRSFDSAASLETCVCPGQIMGEGLPGLDSMSFTDLVESGGPSLASGAGCPQTPVTPTFLYRDAMANEAASPLLEPGTSSYAVPACECVDMQLFHMSQLNHLMTECLQRRLDQSLETIKAAFLACRVFLQCAKCTKDSMNLLLAISVLNLTLQLFEYWVTRETTHALRPEPNANIRYGHYEICQEENRHIRHFLMRGLLLQCREVLSGLKTAVNAAKESRCREPTTSADESGSQAWTSPGTPDVVVAADSDADSAPGNSALLPIIAGYEATVEAFLQSVAVGECICGHCGGSKELS